MSFFLFANSSSIVRGCFTDALITGAESTTIFFALLSFTFVVSDDESMPFALSLCCLLFSANFTSNKSFCFCANIFTASFASTFPPSPDSFSNSSLWCLSMCIFSRSLCLNGSRSQYGHCKDVALFFFSSKKFASGLLDMPPVATMPFFFFINSFRGPPILAFLLLLLLLLPRSARCHSRARVFLFFERARARARVGGILWASASD